MHRQKAVFKIASGDAGQIKSRMLYWAQQYSILLFLDSNNYQQAYGRYECLLAAGSINTIAGDIAQLPPLLHQGERTKKDWYFGHISYDYKNCLEPKLSSKNQPKINLPECCFFCPEVVCYIDIACTALIIESNGISTNQVYSEICNAKEQRLPLPSLSFRQVMQKEAYINQVGQIRQHIADGDCYELNFCSEGFCENAYISPIDAYLALMQLSPAPFAAFYKHDDIYTLCASPERFLKKEGTKLIAQPIKGTARRAVDVYEDEKIKSALQQSIKERAENVMIVDLMRNDLAKCCKTGSINVDELFSIYSFPQVHQMISTVSGGLRDGLGFADIIRSTFPVGSMTGAPKHKVMQLIDRYEMSHRGLFSGTLGYISPDGDFDFNVVIRSLFYDAQARYLCYQAGGAITYDSDPVQEWEEMRLKAWALERIFA